MCNPCFLYKECCVLQWPHDREAKETATGLSVTALLDTFLLWNVRWEGAEGKKTEGKGLLTTCSKNRACHPRLFLIWFFYVGIKGWGSTKRAFNKKFLKSKIITSSNSEVKMLQMYENIPDSQRCICVETCLHAKFVTGKAASYRNSINIALYTLPVKATVVQEK